MGVSNKSIRIPSSAEMIDGALKVGFAKAAAPAAADFGTWSSTIPEGSIYWDTVGQTLYVRNSSSGWTAMGGAAGGTFDLDTAYNNGRTITADDTAITYTHSHATAILMDINRTGTGSGVAIDIAHAGATTGAAINLNMTNAVAANALTGTLAGARTADGVSITHSGTGAADIFALTMSSTPSGHVFDINLSGAVTGNIIDVAQSAATTGSVLRVVDSAATTGAVLNIDKGDSTSTGNVFTIDMGDNVAGSVLALTYSAAIRTTDDISITASAALHTSDIFAISDGSTRSGDIFDIDISGAMTGNVVTLTYSGAATGYALDIDAGASASMSALVRMDLGADTAGTFFELIESDGARSDHRIKITTGTGAHTGGTFDINDVSTGSVPMFDIDFTGLYTGTCLDITYGTAAATGNALDVNMGTNLAGNALDIARAGVATGKCIALSSSGAATGDFLEIALANTTAAIAIDLVATVAATVQHLNVDSSAVLANNVGAIEVDHGTGDIIAGGALVRIDSDAALANGAVASNTPVALLELVQSSATATAYTALVVDLGASARTEPGIWIEDNQTAAGSGPVFDIDLISNTTGAAQIFDIDVSNVAWAGDVFNINIGGATTVAGQVMVVDASAAHTAELFEITTNGVLANNKAVFDIIHATGAQVAGSSLMRISSSAVTVAGAVASDTPCSLLELVQSSATATAVTALVVDLAGAIRTEPAIWVEDNQAATGSGATFKVDLTANTTGAASVFDVNVSNVAYAGKVLDIDIGGATTVAATALYVDATAAHTGQIVNIDSSGVLANNVGLVEIDHGTGVLIAGSALLRVDSDVDITNAAYGVEVVLSAATAAIGLNVNGGAVARTSNLVEVIDSSTDTTGASLYVDNQTAGGKALHVDAGYARFDGRIMGAKGADVASGTDITLGGDGNYFDITGTTTITTISATGWTAGSVVTLQFDGSVTVSHNVAGTGASFLLSGAGNLSATANDTLTLVYDGVTWREMARTVI